ncbi:hypothetical protein M011DRAFT_409355 [Sporormia fimetaria CBS 119925]|uniref:Autophagy-related protein 13 n=1 Tax=Sporormia fimetaria CBS 119925 TaxID=1340428 RepID=A0A6A6V497_9PLEO|nr:hypothetical protein M011DRAFT_409355 [Sporormia fimetaria CBS 119925]
MYPHSRSSPRAASAATNPQTNPTRTNNSRDHHSARSSPYSDPLSYSERGSEEGDGEMVPRTEQLPDTEPTKTKINQVIQNFFTKSALTIVSSRVTLPQAFNRNGELRYNRWFNVVLEETDVLAHDLSEWKSTDAVDGPHSRLCIEIYLDVRGLGPKQSLVIHDSEGKRWDVADALENLGPAARGPKSTQIVLERWMVYIGDKDTTRPSELQDTLPNVYKKAVVLFRSLYAYCRLLPAFRYSRALAKQPANLPSLKMDYRILNADIASPHQDTLSVPLYPSSESIVETQDFTPSNAPVGPLCISVQYRSNCDFAVVDSESLLSSQFMGIDDTYMTRDNRDPARIPGSLPVTRLHAQETPDLGQAYGSMSTFHQVGPPPGTSPMSALRAARDMPSSSPRESPPQKLPPNHRTAQGSKSSLRSNDAPSYQRRPSVSFQPFKAGSLSSSPAAAANLPSPSSSLGRPSSSLGRPSYLNQPRNRTSLTALPQTALRTPSLTNETAITSSASSSPKPAPITRYSSSFSQRRSKFSSGGGSKTEDDNVSSGKGSATSSHQPGSDVLGHEGDAASSGSIKTDDENISDFLKLLEQKKDLRSFNKNDHASRDASTRRTTAQLSKYQRLKESHVAMTDSISSSVVLHRSSTSSSRHLTNVPQMIAGTSFSTSSSPGKPISPHTPHTPAIPSRLSANSIVEYEPRRSRSRPGQTSHEQDASNDSDPSSRGTQTTAIDIPTSPRPWSHARRSSSVAQQNRTLEDETDIFGLRAASLPTDDMDRDRDVRPVLASDLTSSGLFAQTELLASATAPGDPHAHAVLSRDVESRDDLPRTLSTSDLPSRRGGSAYSASSRRRGSSGRVSAGSLLTPGGSSTTERQSRYQFPARTTPQDDEEPLLFQMSELQGRRSLEGERGGGSAGSGSGSGTRRGGWMR